MLFKFSIEKKDGELSNSWFDYIGLFDLIVFVSDWGVIYYIGMFIDYDGKGFEFFYFLFGVKLLLKLVNYSEIIG